MNDLEKESIKDETLSRGISASTLLIWVCLILMIVAYIGGFTTTDEPDEKHGSGVVGNNDSAIVTQRDIVTGK